MKNLQRVISRFFLPGLLMAFSTLAWTQNSPTLESQSNTKAPSLSLPNPAAGTSKESNSLQSVAVVNGQSISAAQLNAASAQSLAGVTDPAAQLRIKNQVLNNIINQALVMQALANNQFVLSPEDQAQIENLKQQAIFNFYIAKQVGTLPKPNNQAIDDYIRKNHNVFDNRKTYHFTQILIESNDARGFSAIKELVQKGATLNDITTWLTQEKIPYSRNNVWRGTEQINPTTLKILEGLKTNVIDVQLTPDEKLIQILLLQGAYADPVNIEDARSGIIRGIAQDASNKAAKLAIDNLRSKADIRITDDALVQSLASSPIEKQTYSAPATISAKIIAAWIFALLIFVPACAINLYCQITPPTPDREFTLQDADLFRAAQLPSWMSVYTLRIPIILIISAILLAPMVSFLLSPPAWITISKLLSTALIGLCLGLFTILALHKLKPLHWFWRKKWIPVGVLIAVEIVIFIVS